MSAYADALKLLARRELSEAQVRQRLARKGHTEPDIDQAVARLVADRSIDDARVAEAIARTETAVRKRGTSQYGMQTFDQSIFALYEHKDVTYEEALRWASNKDEFKLRVQGISTTSDETREQMARSATSRPSSSTSQVTRFGR